MTRVPETGAGAPAVDSRALPAAPMAMPEQVLERPRHGGASRGALFATLLKRLALK